MIKVPINILKLNKLFEKLLKGTTKKKQRKLLLYLKLYGNLLIAESLLTSATYSKFISYMVIIKKLLNEVYFSTERTYLKRLSEIVGIILKFRKYNENNIPTIKTRLLVAQNICTLRILRVGE